MKKINKHRQGRPCASRPGLSGTPCGGVGIRRVRTAIQGLPPGIQDTLVRVSLPGHDGIGNPIGDE